MNVCFESDCVCRAVIQRIKEAQQEMVRLSYLELPIRRSDLLFNTCGNKGQEARNQQEAAVREKAGAAFFRGSLSQWRGVGSGIKDILYIARVSNVEAASVWWVNLCRSRKSFFIFPQTRLKCPNL